MDCRLISTWSRFAAIPMILLDANVILDILDPTRLARMVEHQFTKLSVTDELGINASIYAEISTPLPCAALTKTDDLGFV